MHRTGKVAWTKNIGTSKQEKVNRESNYYPVFQCRDYLADFEMEKHFLSMSIWLSIGTLKLSLLSDENQELQEYF